MTKKSAVILSSAVLLLAGAALAVRRLPANQAQAQVPPVHPGGSCSTGKGLPHRAQVDMGVGQITAALSASKMLNRSRSDAYVSVNIEARPAVHREARGPARLVLVIDRSGSMAGEKLSRAQESASGIIDRLDARDSVGIVQYDDSVQVLARPTLLDPAGRTLLKRIIAELGPGGGTNLHGGLVEGLAELGRGNKVSEINRLILLSDGQANVGVVDPIAIAATARKAAEQGRRITTIGMGVDYNEDLMEAIAESGRGQYHYVRDAAGLTKVFAKELEALQGTVATSVELVLEPACAGVEIVDVYGYEWHRQGASVSVPMADLYGSESRRLTAKLHIPAGAAGSADVLRVRLAHRDPSATTVAQSSLALGVEMTADPVAAEASTEKSVVAAAIEVESGVAMRRAAEEYQQGRRAQALQLLADQQTRMQEQSKKYGLPQAAIEQPMRQMAKQSADTNAFEPNSFMGKGMIKGSKSSARSWGKGSYSKSAFEF